MSVRKPPDRIINPSNQPDTHIEKRHGVRTRRQLVHEQQATARRSPAPVIKIGDADVLLGKGIRQINLTGAGVVVTVLGDTATVTIA